MALGTGRCSANASGMNDAGVTGTEPTPDMSGPGPPQLEADVSAVGASWVSLAGSQVVWRVLGFPLSAPFSPGCSLMPLRLPAHSSQFFKRLGWFLQTFYLYCVLCILIVSI